MKIYKGTVDTQKVQNEVLKAVYNGDIKRFSIGKATVCADGATGDVEYISVIDSFHIVYLVSTADWFLDTEKLYEMGLVKNKDATRFFEYANTGEYTVAVNTHNVLHGVKIKEKRFDLLQLKNGNYTVYLDVKQLKLFDLERAKFYTKGPLEAVYIRDNHNMCGLITPMRYTDEKGVV